MTDDDYKGFYHDVKLFLNSDEYFEMEDKIYDSIKKLEKKFSKKMEIHKNDKETKLAFERILKDLIDNIRD